MTAQKFSLILIFTLFTLVPSVAQDYQLGWDEINSSSAKAADTYTLGWQDVDRHVDRSEGQLVEFAPEAPVAAPPNIVNVRPPAPQATQRSAYAPTDRTTLPSYNIELAASQFYDVYAEKYKVVRAVEVSTFRMGRSTCETFENRGACTQYQVYMKDLKPGDTYKVRVVWEDGSNRTIEKTIDTYYTDRNVYVNQPDYLAYTAY
jgi:archaellin